jgi:DNA-binding NtrC family response regulator
MVVKSLCQRTRDDIGHTPSALWQTAQNADSYSMEVLLVEKDPMIRSQVKVGLQQFEEFDVTVGQGQAGISEARGQVFDCVFLGVDPREKDEMKLLQHLRSFDSATELFVLTDPRHIKDMAGDKSKYDIHSFVQTPIVVKEFFGLLGRFLERRTDRKNSALRKHERTGNVV